MKLDDYFDAYDRAHELSAGAADWVTLRKKVRRSLARPAFELAGKMVYLVACLAFGIWGHRIGYLLALGALCFIPQYVGRLRAQIASVRELSSEGDLQQHLEKEAQRGMAGAVIALLFYTGFTVLFLGVAALAAWMDKDFRSSLAVSLVFALLATYALLFRLPRASREIASLGKKSGNSKDGKEDSHGK